MKMKKTITQILAAVVLAASMSFGNYAVLAEDNISGYARRVYSGGMLTYTNVPEPEPQPEPEPEPTEVEQLRAQVTDLQNQILTMRLGG